MGKPRIIINPTPLIRKQAGQMRKLIGLWNGRKDKAAPLPILDGKPSFLASNKGLTQTHVTRRQIVLNRHFTEIISDVLANNLKRELRDMGTSITSIETKAWNKGVRIFYTTSKPFNLDLHNNLNSLITLLRAAISERRLIGRVPIINFVYDETALFERQLDQALANIKLDPEQETKTLVKSSSDKLTSTPKGLADQEPVVIGRNFSAPCDMSNTILGLDYPKFYDRVAAKLERGRGESSRIISHSALAGQVFPFIKPDNGITDEDNPMTRIIKMNQFIVSQKKKSTHLARLKRKQELLARDAFKWDYPEEEFEREENIV